MIPALKKPFTYILTFIFVLIGVGVPFLVYGISVWSGHSPFPYYYLHLIFACVFAFLAYLLGDIVIIKYRKENPEANKEEFPVEINEKIWLLRWPCIFAMITLLLLFAVFFIIYSVTKSWPLF